MHMQLGAFTRGVRWRKEMNPLGLLFVLLLLEEFSSFFCFLNMMSFQIRRVG